MTSVDLLKNSSQTAKPAETRWKSVLKTFRSRGNPSVAVFRIYFLAAAVCFVSVELWRVAMILGQSISATYLTRFEPLTILSTTFIVCLFGCLHLLERGAYSSVRRLLRSNRADIALIGIAGGVGGFFWSEFAPERYEAFIQTVPPIVALYSVVLVTLVGFASSVRTRVISFRAKSQGRSALIDDRAITKDIEDGLGISEMAERFALNVLNERSPTSLIFGIDSPWGTGKSSFINVCRQTWEKHDATIVYDFEPLRFEGKGKLVQKFIDGFVKAINQKIFVPEVEPLLSRYARLIGQSDISILGLKVSLKPDDETIEETLGDLRQLLASVRTRIIVIVDDLDRLDLESVKEVLFAIRTSFDLPYVNFVLCYDTLNLGGFRSDKSDAEKIREFLEKYVNVKFSLFIDSQAMLNYVTRDFETALGKNLEMSPQKIDQVKEAISALKEIFKGNEYSDYLPLIGDLRKIKRVINTLVMLELEKIDRSSSDLDGADLLNLLLLYLNFPDLFRKLYDSETSGRNGLFSVRKSKSSAISGKVYRNTKKYHKLVATLTDPQAFLLNKIFGADSRLKNTYGEVSEDEILSFACFNGLAGNGERNLERYLQAIVKVAKPNRKDGLRYLADKKKLLVKGTPIARILAESEFDIAKGETLRDQFWSILANTAHELPVGVGPLLIEQIVETIDEYSQLELPEIGLGARDNLPYILIKILEDAGWGGNSSDRRNNSPENIAEIAHRILGVGPFERSGILERLARVRRGPLGVFDMLLFRLQCCADRGGRTFNISRALALHENVNAPTAGVTSEIAKHQMRIASQKAFSLFFRDYIDTKKNFLLEVDKLSIEELVGVAHSYLNDRLADETVTLKRVNEAADIARSRIKSFCIYQLSNDIISSGVGCGYYDVSGANDNHEIKRRMSEYLFEVCFRLDVSGTNAGCFVDYMLLGFQRLFDTPGAKDFVPDLESVSRVLDANLLFTYWVRNERQYRGMNLQDTDREVRTSNVALTYSEAVPRLFDALTKWAAQRQ